MRVNIDYVDREGIFHLIKDLFDNNWMIMKNVELKKQLIKNENMISDIYLNYFYTFQYENQKKQQNHNSQKVLKINSSAKLKGTARFSNILN